MNDIYRPRLVTVRKTVIENEARDIKTFELVFLKQEEKEQFRFSCGQFAMLSVPGAGESPIGIASSPLDDEYLHFTVKRYPTGVVTTALHSLEEGSQIGVRGPYGNFYPFESMEGKSIVIVGGGFAFTTLRSTIRYLLHDKNRSRFRDITVLYGARSPGELIYKSELKQWEERDDVNMYITVDKGEESWKGRVGLIPNILSDIAPSSEDSIALVCGPPIMLKYTMPPLVDLGFSPERIITSLERRMSCGIGKCGRCNIGSKFVCKDGPIFTYKELRELPEAAL